MENNRCKPRWTIKVDIPRWTINRDKSKWIINRDKARWTINKDKTMWTIHWDKTRWTINRNKSRWTINRDETRWTTVETNREIGFVALSVPWTQALDFGYIDRYKIFVRLWKFVDSHVSLLSHKNPPKIGKIHVQPTRCLLLSYFLNKL